MKLDGERQPLDTLADRELSAVTFVRDYVQLHFDGPTISAFTLPTIEVASSRVTAGAPGYRDSLCARIGTAVGAAYVDPGLELRIALTDGSFIIVSLKPEDRDVAEAAVFSDPQTNEWASW
jgi:hypothetical protein